MWNRHIPSNNSDIAIILELETLLDIKPVKSKRSESHLDNSLHPDVIRLLEEFLHNGMPITLITGYGLPKTRQILGKTLRSISVIGAYGAETELAGASSRSGAKKTPVNPNVVKIHQQLVSIQNTYPEARYELSGIGARISSKTHPKKLDEIYSELIATAANWGNDFRLVMSQDTLELSHQSSSQPNRPTHNYGIAIAKLMSHRKLRSLKPCFIGSSMAAETGFLMSNILDGMSINFGDMDNSHAKFQLSHKDSIMNSLSTLSSAENIKTKTDVIFNLDLVAA